MLVPNCANRVLVIEYRPSPNRAAVVAQVSRVEVARGVQPVGPQAERPGREAQHHRREEADRPGLERLDRGQHRAQDQHGPDPEQRERRQVADLAEQQREALLEAVADLAAVPAQVEDEREEAGERDQAQADQVHVALLELRHGRPRERGALRADRRALARGGLAGSCWHRWRPVLSTSAADILAGRRADGVRGPRQRIPGSEPTTRHVAHRNPQAPTLTRAHRGAAPARGRGPGAGRRGRSASPAGAATSRRPAAPRPASRARRSSTRPTRLAHDLAIQLAKPWPRAQKDEGRFRSAVGGGTRYGDALLSYALLQHGLQEDNEELVRSALKGLTFAVPRLGTHSRAEHLRGARHHRVLQAAARKATRRPDLQAAAPEDGGVPQGLRAGPAAGDHLLRQPLADRGRARAGAAVDRPALARPARGPGRRAPPRRAPVRGAHQPAHPGDGPRARRARRRRGDLRALRPARRPAGLPGALARLLRARRRPARQARVPRGAPHAHADRQRVAVADGARRRPGLLRPQPGAGLGARRHRLRRRGGRRPGRVVPARGGPLPSARRPRARADPRRARHPRPLGREHRARASRSGGTPPRRAWTAARAARRSAGSPSCSSTGPCPRSRTPSTSPPGSAPTAPAGRCCREARAASRSCAPATSGSRCAPRAAASTRRSCARTSA